MTIRIFTFFFFYILGYAQRIENGENNGYHLISVSSTNLIAHTSQHTFALKPKDLELINFDNITFPRLLQPFQSPDKRTLLCKDEKEELAAINIAQSLITQNKAYELNLFLERLSCKKFLIQTLLTTHFSLSTFLITIKHLTIDDTLTLFQRHPRFALKGRSWLLATIIESQNSAFLGKYLNYVNTLEKNSKNEEKKEGWEDNINIDIKNIPLRLANTFFTLLIQNTSYKLSKKLFKRAIINNIYTQTEICCLECIHTSANSVKMRLLYHKEQMPILKFLIRKGLGARSLKPWLLYHLHHALLDIDQSTQLESPQHLAKKAITFFHNPALLISTILNVIDNKIDFDFQISLDEMIKKWNNYYEVLQTKYDSHLSLPDCIFSHEEIRLLKKKNQQLTDKE